MDNLHSERKNIPFLQEKQALITKAIYDKTKIDHAFHQNDLILVRQAKNIAKSKFKVDGPFRIIKKKGRFILSGTNA